MYLFSPLCITLKRRCGNQVRNQLGTPVEEKSFLRWDQVFKLCPIILNYAHHISPRGAKSFVGRASLPPCVSPGYGLVGTPFPHPT